MLGTADGPAHTRLLQVLKDRLPGVHADETREWTVRQKEPLLWLLRSWHEHTELACTILQAMPEIGGAWALETVERLAEFTQWAPDRLRAAYHKASLETSPWEERPPYIQRPSPDPAEREETLASFLRIGNAAAACLPVLREKVRSEEAARVLLRASSVGNSPGQLLRPAEDKSRQTDIANLPRASAPPVPEETLWTHRR